MRTRLTIDHIYDSDKKLDFDGSTFPDVIWIDDSSLILRKTDPKTEFTEWVRIDAASGDSSPLYDAARMQAAIQRLPGVSEDEARRLAHLPSYVMDPERKAVVLNHANDLFYHRFDSDDFLRLTTTAAPVVGEEFSPDGNLVSFIRGSNLYLVDIRTQREWALTDDGTDRVLNGRLDWVYQEELYGRGNFKGYWWSPDSKKIAYLRFDETELREFSVVDHIPFQSEIERTHYPLAGDPNPEVQLFVVNAEGGAVRRIDTSKYESIDFLIVRVGWTPDSASVVYQVQDREQRWLDLNIGDKTILSERTDKWVNVTGEPRFLNDGSFLWLSERSGWKHVYRYTRDRSLTTLTEGNWEVRDLHSVDEKNGFAYFTANRDDPVANHTYRVRIRDGAVERLTHEKGSHRSIFSPKAAYFADYSSRINAPVQVRLHDSYGRELRVLHACTIEVLNEFDLGSVELLQIPARDGFPLEAMIIKPPGFDPARRYPVMSYTYSGPHNSQVTNAWGGEKYLFHQMLAQMGYVVWICDNRSASGKGAASMWPVYRNLGASELRDLEDGVAWLCRQSFVDPSRIGLWGWSFGGFMTLYALTHTTIFKAGISGAPVTDWRNYDSIYTERYMATPENNPSGYDASSIVKAAGNLHGQLLLVHGATDDNVHLQNTMQLVYELQKAGKQFELMIYPRTRHAVTDAAQLKHLRKLMSDFIVKNV